MHPGLWTSVMVGGALLSIACVGKGPNGGGDCPSGWVTTADGCDQVCIGDDDCEEGICHNGLCGDHTRPSISAHVPEADATGVSADTAIVITFSEPMEPQSTEAALFILGEVGGVSGSVSWGSNHRVLTFTPTMAFKPGETCLVEIDAKATSQAGVPLGRTYTFNFEIYLAPLLVQAMQPTPGSVEVGVLPLISVTFTVPIVLDTLLADRFALAAGSTTVQGTLSLDDASRVATFTPGTNLEYDTTYTLAVQPGVLSQEGAELTTAFIGNFATTATPDFDPPEITIDPIDGVLSGLSLDEFNAYTFMGTAHDNETAIERVQVQVVEAGNDPHDDEWKSANYSAGDWSYAWFPLAGGARPDGSFLLYARAFDKGGNITTISSAFVADFEAPLLPDFAAPPPATWKFKTFTFDVVGDPNTFVRVLLNSSEIAGSPFALEVDGAYSNISVELPQQAEPSVIALFGLDEYGNENSSPRTAFVQRVGYTCLSAANGFPVDGAVLADSWSDDGEGLVSLTYVLSGGLAEDTYMYSTHTSTNYGASNTIQIGSSNSYRGLLRININDLWPTCAGIESASLALYSTGVSWDCTCTGVTATLAKRPWLEHQATWQRYDAATYWHEWGAQGSDDIDTGYSASFSDGSFNMTDLVLRWQNHRQGLGGASENNGVVLHRIGSSTFSIASSEHSTADRRPRLQVVLREPPP